MSDTFRIVTQNLNGANETNIEIYKKKVQADIYAFQELPENSNNITTFFSNESNIVSFSIEIEEIAKKAKKSWDEVFHKKYNVKSTDERSPWQYDFKSGYWKEAILNFQNEPIKIINIHLSPDTYYNEQLRYVLTKRLYDLEKEFENVLLLGDFNTAEYHQTETPNTWAQAMYHTITDIFSYTELFCDNEDLTNPHYTFFKYKKQKIDHIFVSSNLYNLLQKWNYKIQYIDTAELGLNPSSDHLGIFLEIGYRDIS